MALFHLVRRAEWASMCDAQRYAPASLEAEGFIHFSTERQLLRTAARFFAGADDLLVVSVRADRLEAPLRWEAADGDTFPHLYGPLNLDAVVEVLPLERDAEGRFALPNELTRGPGGAER